MIKFGKHLLIFGALLLITTWSSAQPTFQKSYGGAWADLGESVQQTNDGGFIIGGSTQSFGIGDYDLYLIRTDANGDTLWTSIINTPASLTDMGFSVRQTNDGGFALIGEVLDIVTSSKDVYLVKTDGAGNLLWTKTYGGYGDQVGYSIEQTTDGGFIIGGDYVDFINNDFNIYLVKTNAIGDTLWSRVIGGANDDHGCSAIQTSDDGFIISGWTNSFGVVNDEVFLVKTDSMGNSLWAKTYGGSGYDVGYSVQQLNDGGYIIGGFTTSFTPAGYAKVYLIRTDGSGDTLWTKFYTAGIGTGIGAYSVRQTASGDFILAGISDGNGAGGYDIYLLKVDGNGNPGWSKTYGGTSADFGNSAQETIDGGFIIAGYSQNSGSGDDDVYLIKTDSMGNSGCNQTNVLTIACSPSTQVGSPVPSVVSLGVIGAPVPLVQHGGTVNIFCSGNVGITEVFDLNSMVVAPNPSSGNFTIAFSNNIIGAEIQIFNVFGAKVFTITNQHTLITEINLKNIPEGIYFVKVVNESKYYCRKIIIEHD